jgi:hypothetical protein
MNPFEIYIHIINTCHNKGMCKERSIKKKGLGIVFQEHEEIS